MSGADFRLPVPDLSAWRAGNTGVEGVWRFESGRPGRSVLITALVHGNELCGAWALTGLLQSGLRPAAGVLTLAFCNLAAFDRFDPGDHDASRFVEEDLNRQWSPDRLRSATTLGRRRAAELAPFVHAADWLLDLHSMHEPGPPLLLTGLASRHLALALALRGPGDVVIDAGHAEGTRLRDHGGFGRPDEESPGTRSLLVECGFHGDPASRVVAEAMTARFLAQAGTVDAQTLEAQLPGWAGPEVTQRRIVRVTGAVVARSERFRFARTFEPMASIPAAGTVIGDNDGEPVVTPHDDCVLVMPSVRQARAGVTVVRFARLVG